MNMMDRVEKIKQCKYSSGQKNWFLENFQMKKNRSSASETKMAFLAFGFWRRVPA